MGAKVINQSGRVRLDSGRRVEYRLIGGADCENLILFYPGSPAAGDSFLKPEVVAAMNVSLLIVSRPGYGLSDPLVESKHGVDTFGSISQVANDAIYVLHRMQLNEHKVVVVGRSGGGPYAAAFAADHPARNRALLLLASGVPRGLRGAGGDSSTSEREQAMSRSERTAYVESVCRDIKLDTAAHVATIESTLPSGHPDRYLLTDSTFRRYVATTHAKGLTGKFGGLGWIGDWERSLAEGDEFLKRTGRISAPTYICLSTDDMVATARHTAAWRVAMPHAHTILRPNSGHMFWTMALPEILGRLSNEDLSFLDALAHVDSRTVARGFAACVAVSSLQMRQVSGRSGNGLSGNSAER